MIPYLQQGAKVLLVLRLHVGQALDLLRDVCGRTDRPVVASGGITELADLGALMALVTPGQGGVEGAIVGTALYEGRFTLVEALDLTWPARGGQSR